MKTKTFCYLATKSLMFIIICLLICFETIYSQMSCWYFVDVVVLPLASIVCRLWHYISFSLNVFVASGSLLCKVMSCPEPNFLIPLKWMFISFLHPTSIKQLYDDIVLLDPFCHIQHLHTIRQRRSGFLPVFPKTKLRWYPRFSAI